MRYMRDYDNYEEWLKGREAVRGTLHILDKDGNEVPDDMVDSNLNCAYAVRADDDEAMEFLYSYHCSCDLFSHDYDGIRKGLYLVTGDTYAFDDEFGWMDVTKMMQGLVPTVTALAERFKA